VRGGVETRRLVTLACPWREFEVCRW
jgi:hypothetical protein